MAFYSNPLEIHPQNDGLNFVFEQEIQEGQTLAFVARFALGTTNAETISDKVFGAITESFERNTVSDPYNRFEEALKAGNMEARKYLSHMPMPPEVTVAYFDFLDVFISQTPKAMSYLLRGSNLMRVTDGPEDHTDSPELFENILSGNVSLNDILLLTTSDFLGNENDEKLIQHFIEQPFHKGVEVLPALLETMTTDCLPLLVLGIGRATPKPQKTGMLGHLANAGKVAVGAVAGAVGSIKAKTSAMRDDETHMTKGTDESDATASPLRLSMSRAKGQLATLKDVKISKNVALLAGGIGVILLFLLIGKLVSGFESEETADLRTQLDIAEQSLVQADQFLLQGDGTSASEFLQKAQEAVDVLMQSKKTDFRADAQLILSTINEKRMLADNAESVTAIELADLGLSIDGVNADGALMMRNSLYIFDERNIHKAIRNAVEPGPSISKDAEEYVVAAAARADQNTILALTNTPRIIEYRDREITAMTTEDQTWKRGNAIDTYGQFAYILDPVSNQIWKYRRGRASYSGATPYNVDSKADLSQGIDLSIDGSIYVLNADGTITKLYQGQDTGYVMTGLPSMPLEGANLRFYTSATQDYIYVLDPSNERLLVLQKGENEAVYKKQILFGIENIVDFAVNEDGTKASLLSSDRIYEIPL